ncbi:MAG: hypothetical protein ACK4N5_19755, partial [Myxococcales bacterium]
MLRPVRQDFPSAAGARGRPEAGPVGLAPRPEPRRAGSEGLNISLHAKIFLGYLVFAAALFASFNAMEAYGITGLLPQLAVTFAVAAVLGLLLPAVIARVKRIRLLNRSALEISRGDLSKPVQQEARLKWLQASSAGVDNLPHRALQEKGVIVTDASGVH